MKGVMLKHYKNATALLEDWKGDFLIFIYVFCFWKLYAFHIYYFDWLIKSGTARSNQLLLMEFLLR